MRPMRLGIRSGFAPEGWGWLGFASVMTEGVSGWARAYSTADRHPDDASVRLLGPAFQKVRSARESGRSSTLGSSVV